ncbi:MAG: hypothetical protein AABW50_03345 [Nanoarchaeota archaeon]
MKNSLLSLLPIPFLLLSSCYTQKRMPCPARAILAPFGEQKLIKYGDKDPKLFVWPYEISIFPCDDLEEIALEFGIEPDSVWFDYTKQVNDLFHPTFKNKKNFNPKKLIPGTRIGVYLPYKDLTHYQDSDRNVQWLTEPLAGNNNP